MARLHVSSTAIAPGSVLKARQAFLDHIAALNRTTTTSRMAKPSKSTTASFMGLPAELRLRIYAYLLVPKQSLRDRQNNSHCCHIHDTVDENARRQQQHQQVKCAECSTSNYHPQILATRREILNEAMAVLYGSTEFLAQFTRLPQDMGDAYRGHKLFYRLPKYSHRHIKFMTVADHEGIVFDGVRTHGYVKGFWKDLKQRCLKLETLRLHIHIFRTHTDCSAFRGISEISSLKQVIVQVHDRGTTGAADGIIQRRRIVGVIEEEASKTGKELRVLETLAE